MTASGAGGLTEKDIRATRMALAELRQLAEKRDARSFGIHLWNRAEHLRRYLLSFQLEGAPENLTAQYVTDALARFLRTLETVPLPPGPRILEIGSNPYFFHLLLHKFFPGSEICGMNFFDHNIFSTDIGSLTQRITSEAFGETHDFVSTLFNLETVEYYPFPDEHFDLIFYCETLEHLVVDPLATFTRLRRILRPGGHLIVTLPNAVRLTNLALMLEGYNFFDVYSANGVHGRHNREFTLPELVHLLQQNGYSIVRAETHDRFDYDAVDVWSFDCTGLSQKLSRKKRDVLQVLKAAKGQLNDRGDNLYVLARVPG